MSDLVGRTHALCVRAADKVPCDGFSRLRETGTLSTENGGIGIGLRWRLHPASFSGARRPCLSHALALSIHIQIAYP